MAEKQEELGEYADDRIFLHLDHLEDLEVAWYGETSDPVSVTVECTRCGSIVVNLWEPY